MLPCVICERENRSWSRIIYTRIEKELSFTIDCFIWNCTFRLKYSRPLKNILSRTTVTPPWAKKAKIWLFCDGFLLLAARNRIIWVPCKLRLFDRVDYRKVYRRIIYWKVDILNFECSWIVLYELYLSKYVTHIVLWCVRLQIRECECPVF